jgi:hypothetical protein
MLGRGATTFAPVLQAKQGRTGSAGRRRDSTDGRRAIASTSVGYEGA